MKLEIEKGLVHVQAENSAENHVLLGVVENLYTQPKAAPVTSELEEKRAKNREAQRRWYAKKRKVKKMGHRLTEEEIRGILEDYYSKTMSTTQIGKKYNCAHATVLYHVQKDRNTGRSFGLIGEKLLATGSVNPKEQEWRKLEVSGK